MNIKRVMLMITENCNLKCSYCYEHEKGTRGMAFTTAKTILDNNLGNITDIKPIILELFGGEPFLNFSLIKQIDDYIVKNYPELKVMYETTTNGTLVHGEIQEWLYEHRNRLIISLSLDGTRACHNLNRPFKNNLGSYDSIDISFFIKTWPGCSAKMTISQQTLANLCENIQYIDKLGFKCDATLSIGCKWDKKSYLNLFIEELKKLVQYYTDNPDIKLCTLLNFDFRLIFTNRNNEDYRFCGAGIDLLCYDINGDIYPCQGFAPVSIGIRAYDFINYDQNNFKLSNISDCKTCLLLKLCSNCYAANYQSTGHILKVDPNLCDFNKMCVLASAKIQYYRIMKKASFTQDDFLILKAISTIQEKLIKHEYK